MTLPEKRNLWYRISNAPIETLYRIHIKTSLGTGYQIVGLTRRFSSSLMASLLLPRGFSTKCVVLSITYAKAIEAIF